MARLARVVVPGLPHHVTQRGEGGARTFFGDDDFAFFRDLLAEHCRAAGVEVWAWVLMPNHVHLILNPADPDGAPQRAFQSPSALCGTCPRPAKEDRAFLAGAVWRGGDGRRPFGRRAALWRAQPGARPLGRPRAGLALVERPRPRDRRRRWPDDAEAGAPALPALFGTVGR